MKQICSTYCLLTALVIILSSGRLWAAEDPKALPVPAVSPQAATTVSASPSPVSRFFTEGEWYFSWGYNVETWAPTDIHVSQSSLGNNFTIHNVKGHDEPGWTSGIFNKGITTPQNNIRIGRFIDDAHTVAVEISLDHTKYTSTANQIARVSGTINGAPVDSYKVLDDTYFRYLLHNGANHLMLNVVKRLPLIGERNENLSLAAIGKAGVGLMVPHSSNTIMGRDNDVGPKSFRNYFGTNRGWWQFDGWTTGIEAGLRLVLLKPIYLELTDKVAYSSLYDIPVYQGTAHHSLWMNEVIMSMGFTYDGSKKTTAH